MERKRGKSLKNKSCEFINSRGGCVNQKKDRSKGGINNPGSSSTLAHIFNKEKVSLGRGVKKAGRITTSDFGVESLIRRALSNSSKEGGGRHLSGTVVSSKEKRWGKGLYNRCWRPSLGRRKGS